jgi:hypothetical protein
VYLSHPVRRLRENPTEGETVALAVTAADDADTDALVEALTEAGGTVEERLRFGTLRVTVPEPRVAAVCALDGIASVETANTLGITGEDDGEAD